MCRMDSCCVLNAPRIQDNMRAFRINRRAFNAHSRRVKGAFNAHSTRIQDTSTRIQDTNARIQDTNARIQDADEKRNPTCVYKSAEVALSTGLSVLSDPVCFCDWADGVLCAWWWGAWR